MMKTKTEETLSYDECKKHFLVITKFIGERLSKPQLEQYMGLMKLFRSRGIQGEELIASLLNLFEEDEWLTQMFEKLMETEIRELENIDAGEPNERRRRRWGEANDDDVDETDEEEQYYCLCRRCKIGREEANMLIHNKKYGLEPSGGVVLGPFRSIINPKLL